MSEYTPTTERVRRTYRQEGWSSRQGAEAEFDRWLAGVKAEAWDEADKAHKHHLGSALLGGRTPYPTNPYRKVTP